MSLQRKLPIPIFFQRLGNEDIVTWKLSHKSVEVSDEMSQRIDDFEQNYRLHPKASNFHCTLSGLQKFCQEHSPLPIERLIFHSVRCGSTFLYRLFQTDPRMAGWNEPAYFDYLSQNFPRRLKLATQPLGLFHAQGKASLVIKTTGHNIFPWKIFQDAFPEVKKYFVYRDPREIIASLITEPPIYLRARKSFVLHKYLNQSQIASYQEWQLAAFLVKKNFEVALQANANNFFDRLIDYPNIKNFYETLPLSLSTREHYQGLLESGQLTQHSKKRNTVFRIDSEYKRQIVSQYEQSNEMSECLELYKELKKSNKNTI